MINGIPVQEILAFLLLGCGLLFLAGSAIGMLRLPDFYTRIHASGNSETLGLMLVLSGLAVHQGFTVLSAKLVLVFLFIFIGNPIGSHILSKAAYKTGHPMWTCEKAEEIAAREEAEHNADLHH